MQMVYQTAHPEIREGSFGGGGSGGKANSNTDRSGGNGGNGLVIITPCYSTSLNYNHERNITIDHTKVSGGENLYNFPVMISFPVRIS